jgi:hypothetical protein
MFARVIDDLRQSAGSALRLTSLAAVMAVALFVTVSFLCAAAFVYVLQGHGPVAACLTGAAIFLLVALVAAVLYAARKRSAQAREAAAAARSRSTMQSALSDPVLMSAGIQVVRAIGLKRLIPIVAVGGLALGLLASRSTATDEAPAE